MGVARNRRGVMIAVVTVGLVQSMAFPNIAQAGFFDFLFGQPQPSAVRLYEGYPARVPPHWDTDPGFRRRADRGFHRHGHKLTARRNVILADTTTHPFRPHAPTDLMEDESLRDGDAVMTPRGIRVFIGDYGNHHQPEDFRKLSEIKGLPKRTRTALAALAALDAQGSSMDGKPGMVTGRSATDLKVTIGETIIDPKGRSIRYVGP